MATSPVEGNVYFRSGKMKRSDGHLALKRSEPGWFGSGLTMQF